MIGKRNCLSRVLTFSLRNVHKCIALMLSFSLWGVSMSAAPAKAPRITHVSTTAETSTSAEVIWNTSSASDSLLQYSTSNPVPAQAPQVYSGNPVTTHEIPLTGLAPGTTYFYRVTSCSKRGCSIATGSFETFPSCPDVVPGVSGSWQQVSSPNISATNNNQLLSVDAVSENDIWAVGWAQDPLGPQYAKRTLIQHFNGSTWDIVQSPNPRNDVNSQLHSVHSLHLFH